MRKVDAISLVILCVALALTVSGVVINYVAIRVISNEMIEIENRLDIRPADVLEAVHSLGDAILDKTDDRFRGDDFRRFLKANPELKSGEE